MKKHILCIDDEAPIRELLKDGPYYAFFTSHLLPVRFEIERQLTNLKHSSTIKE